MIQVCYFLNTIYVVGGSSELPIWLTDGFLAIFWKVEGTMRKHVSHVQLPYKVVMPAVVMCRLWGGGGGRVLNIGKLG